MSEISEAVEYEVRPGLENLEGQKVPESRIVSLSRLQAAYHLRRGRVVLKEHDGQRGEDIVSTDVGEPASEPGSDADAEEEPGKEGATRKRRKAR